jgi:hypothetical protein
MITLVYILLAILAVALVAYLVVNKIPRKFHWIISLILLALIIFVSKKIVDSIMKPIRFNEEKVKRYTKVIDNLKTIRQAEIAYQKVKGKYTDNKQELIDLIDKDSFAIEQPKTKIIKVNRGGGIIIDKEVRVVDTIGWKPVKVNFAGKDYKKMFDLKSEGIDAEIELKTDTIEKVEGYKSWVFVARVPKEQILKGLDSYLIEQEKQSLGGTEVKGEYIQVGSLTDVKTNGNWPPFYDSKDKKDKE